MLIYDVLLLTLSGSLLGHGVLHVPAGVFVWDMPPPPFCTLCNELVNALVEPPQKFLNFKGGKPVGPGALGFPNGIIPCTKYLVEQQYGDLKLKYVVCAYKNVIVYEYYLGSMGAQVSLRPTLDALRYVPFITDPAPLPVRYALVATALLIAALSTLAFAHRHELAVT